MLTEIQKVEGRPGGRADTLFLKYTHIRVCVRFINKGVRRSTRPPKMPAFNAGEWTYESPTRPPRGGEEEEGGGQKDEKDGT